MKNDRQSMILEIISQENIETQEQLLVRLQERGITSTQATISRDIKQMHLIKEPVGHGVYKYAVSGFNLIGKIYFFKTETFASSILCPFPEPYHILEGKI